jgi:adenylate kinase
MHVILMGAQGAGKGTQAERIAPRFALAHLSTGELFRSAIASQSEFGLKLKAILDAGELVPDDVTLGIVDARLAEIGATEGVTGALFDGFPRTPGQAEGLDRVLVARRERIGAVVEIHVPRERLIERLAGRRICPKCNATYHVLFNPPAQEGICDRCGSALIQRPDDTPEAITRRLDLYFEQTSPLLDYYKQRGILTQIAGEGEIDDVTARIAAVIDAAIAEAR